MNEEQYDQDARSGGGEQYDQTDPNEATNQIVFARTRSLTEEDLARAAQDPSTPKCTKMAADIDAAQGDLAAAARKLKGGPPDNEYQLT